MGRLPAVAGAGRRQSACKPCDQVQCLCSTQGMAATEALCTVVCSRCLQEAYARRGAHWTFDGAAFVAAIRRLKQQGAASLPSFDHGVGDPIEDDIQIDAARHAVVLVEGNYLFLEQEPWVQLRELFDDAWFVDCPVDLAMQRVFDRQVAIGLAPEVSLGRIAGNDRPNALLVNASKGAARLLVPSNVPFAGTAPNAGVAIDAAAEQSLGSKRNPL